jgi:hypothetical protein
VNDTEKLHLLEAFIDKVGGLHVESLKDPGNVTIEVQIADEARELAGKIRTEKTKLRVVK